MPIKISPALQLIKLIYLQNRLKSRSSWRDAICQAVDLALKAQLAFDEDDFSYQLHEAGYHSLTVMGFAREFESELWYKMACKSVNTSACKAIEKTLKRTPCILNSKRLYVECEVMIDCKVWKLNSFGTIGTNSGLNFGRYKYNNDTKQTEMIERMKISYADIKAKEKTTAAQFVL